MTFTIAPQAVYDYSQGVQSDGVFTANFLSAAARLPLSKLDLGLGPAFGLKLGLKDVNVSADPVSTNTIPTDNGFVELVGVKGERFDLGQTTFESTV